MESRTQGQDQAHNQNPRPRTALLRIKVLEAKDQEHRCKCFLKKNFFSGNFKKKRIRSSKNFLLVLELRSRGFYVQVYANDRAGLVTGADMLRIRGIAQKGINITANWSSQQELQFSSKKTENILFTHKENPDKGSLSINGSKLKLSKEARLLGVTLDNKLTRKPHITQITCKAITALMQCKQIEGKTWGIKPSNL